MHLSAADFVYITVRLHASALAKFYTVYSLPADTVTVVPRRRASPQLQAIGEGINHAPGCIFNVQLIVRISGFRQQWPSPLSADLSR